MNQFADVNFFTDRAVQDDPYPYFDWVREQGPVWQEPRYGVFMITGHPEAMEVYGDPATFPSHDAPSGTYSSCNAVSGPFVKFSIPVEGDDISDIIVKCRHELPFSDQLPAFDPPNHTAHRHLLMRLITPKRLKENEEFMWQFADRLIDTFVARGSCELVADYAEPFTLTVIADLEGVPEADHALFRERLSTVHEEMAHKPLEFLYERFRDYITERRREPRHDILSGLATATFPDGSTPAVGDAALLAANLFAGGQETTVRLLSFSLRMLGERPDLQQLVRRDRDRIPNFIEETLRLESPLRTQFRMARVRTEPRRRRHPRRRDDHARTRCLQPRSARLRAPGRLRHRPGERAAAHRVRPWHPHLRRRAARPRRGSRHAQPVPRPHRRHRHLHIAPRPGRSPPVRLPPDLLPPRSRALAPGARELGGRRAGAKRSGKDIVVCWANTL